ncbi:DUF262 domain-containing protein [Leptospira jelokensis]|uniref:DUF262 domain-containing protein n=1 Tax=Leptospira jelokensis TaxID=2484931 RepID=UPI0010915D3B|nr:DUF262 domain-containing protein [Leptospira jelokensis]TGM07110.1 DUF262 domain-containing protein [Leptospira jelokensis]
MVKEEIEFEDNEFSEEEESVVNTTPPEERKLFTQAYDKSVSDLVRMITDKDIILNPHYQREYVWDNKRASLLIESIILNVPIPVVYVSQEDDEKWNVIDGLQRLNSLNRFFERDFKLKGLEVLDELNGCDIKTLNPKALRILRNGLIRVVMISSDSDPNIKYDVFMRLNRGSVRLSEQELRNCLYRGPYNDLLKELRSNPQFMDILNLTEKHPRMNEIELIERFFAMFDDWDNENLVMKSYKKQIKRLLNEHMNQMTKIDLKKLNQYKSLFTETIKKVFLVFQNKAFRRIDGSYNYETTLNRALMDCIMVSFTYYSEDKIRQKSQKIIDLLVNKLISDPEFLNSITKSTWNTKAVNYRMSSWTIALRSIM